MLRRRRAAWPWVRLCFRPVRATPWLWPARCLYLSLCGAAEEAELLREMATVESGWVPVISTALSLGTRSRQCAPCACLSPGGLCWLGAHRCQYESPAGPGSHWWNGDVRGSASTPAQHGGLLPQALRDKEWRSRCHQRERERELEWLTNVGRYCHDR